MNNRSTLMSLLMLLVAAVMATTSVRPAPAVTPENNPSARGGGNLQFSNLFITFGFNAVQHKDGTVTGMAEEHNHTINASFHTEITCLDIVGNTAYMSGVVTRSNNPEAPEGSVAVFSAQDNGEGGGAPPDLVNQVILPAGTTLDCRVVRPTPAIPVEGGNVQVRP